MDEIKYLSWLFIAILTMWQGWQFFVLKNNREDMANLNNRINRFGDKHQELKDDVQKNYVTHERMINHIDDKFNQFGDRMGRIEEKLDRLFERRQ